MTLQAKTVTNFAVQCNFVTVAFFRVLFTTFMQRRACVGSPTEDIPTEDQKHHFLYDVIYFDNFFLLQGFFFFFFFFLFFNSRSGLRDGQGNYTNKAMRCVKNSTYAYMPMYMHTHTQHIYIYIYIYTHVYIYKPIYLLW